MEKDIKWKAYLSDDERYADIINGIGCGGAQIVKETDLQDTGTQEKQKARDALRKTAFGVNLQL